MPTSRTHEGLTPLHHLSARLHDHHSGKLNVLLAPSSDHPIDDSLDPKCARFETAAVHVMGRLTSLALALAGRECRRLLCKVSHLCLPILLYTGVFRRSPSVHLRL